MMKIEQVLEELEKIKNTYRELIMTSNYNKVSDFEISWNAYIPGIYKNLYAKEYEILLQKRQYSFLLNDNLGFIQFYFKYSEEENFEKIKMAYYPYPLKLQEEKDDLQEYFDDSNDSSLQEYYFDLWNILNTQFLGTIEDKKLRKIISYLKEESDSELSDNELIDQIFNHKYKITNSSHIRIDFNHQVESHHKCEIQIGAINDIRFPIDRIISPFVFFDFIMRNIDRKSYRQKFNDNDFLQKLQFSKKRQVKIQNFIEKNIFITHID